MFSHSDAWYTFKILLFIILSHAIIGLDIKENYHNLIRVTQFPDAGIWVNVGTDDKSRNKQVRDLTDIYNQTKKPQLVNYQAMDLTKYDVELYIGEVPFFNNPHIFVLAVMEHKKGPVFEYIRPAGAYWEALRRNYHDQARLNAITKTVKHYIPVETSIKGVTTTKETYQVPLYGYHSPNR